MGGFAVVVDGEMTACWSRGDNDDGDDDDDDGDDNNGDYEMMVVFFI